VAHLRENAAGAGLPLADEDLAELDKIGRLTTTDGDVPV
jgi:pyridoxine 4-dehydrogenase